MLQILRNQYKGTLHILADLHHFYQCKFIQLPKTQSGESGKGVSWFHGEFRELVDS